MAALRLRLRLAERSGEPHVGRREPCPLRRPLPAVAGLRQPRHRAVRQGRARRSARERSATTGSCCSSTGGWRNCRRSSPAPVARSRGVEERTVPLYGVLVQPSPMTATADPLLPLLHSDAAQDRRRIRLHPACTTRPSTCRHYAARCRVRGRPRRACGSTTSSYASQHLTRNELLAFLGRPARGTRCRDGQGGLASRRPAHRLQHSAGTRSAGPIVVMTGDEPRKNTFGALAAIGAATAGGDEPGTSSSSAWPGRRPACITGRSPPPSVPARRGRCRDSATRRCTRCSPASSLVVVASFDEGLSLPVIEALRAGAPVVAADIPAHRELIGRGLLPGRPREPGEPRRARSAGTPVRAATQASARCER